MKREICIYLLLLIISIGAAVNAQTVQVGISASGTSLIISARPIGAVNGSYSGGNVTISWPTSYGISLGTITSTVGGPWAQQGSVGTSGSNSYVDIGWTGSATSINWANGSTNELCRVAVNQTGSGTGTFTLTNAMGGGWYFEVAGLDWTEYGTPFYASSVSGVPLPVELTSFTASVNQLTAELEWSTATEVNNYGFEIEKRAVSDKQSAASSWVKIGFVKGNGTSNTKQSYSFSENVTESGSYAYRLKQIDNDGAFKYSQEAEVTIEVPKVFTLNQNYPNPFNPTTTISFTLAQDGITVLRIFDMLGREVATLANGDMKAGVVQHVTFDASRLSSGIYFSCLENNGQRQIKKITLMK